MGLRASRVNYGSLRTTHTLVRETWQHTWDGMYIYVCIYTTAELLTISHQDKHIEIECTAKLSPVFWLITGHRRLILLTFDRARTNELVRVLFSRTYLRYAPNVIDQQWIAKRNWYFPVNQIRRIVVSSIKRCNKDLVIVEIHYRIYRNGRYYKYTQLT